MISVDDQKRIMDQAVAGRGLWLGLYIPETLHKISHELLGRMDTKAHVTITHFGKKNDAARVSGIVRVLNRMLEQQMITTDGWKAEITGVGWFWRREYPTLVALVNSRAICDELRGPLVELLDDLVDKRYGFVPHITLNSNDPFELGRSCGMGVRSISLTFPTMHLVCGDVQVAVR